jgi:hypothetical protein
MSSFKIAGFVAALLWAISCYLWIRSAMVSPKSSLPPPDESKKRGTVMTGGGFYIDGVPQLTAADITSYVKKTGRYNKNAGMVSALAALATAVSLFLTPG